MFLNMYGCFVFGIRGWVVATTSSVVRQESVLDLTKGMILRDQLVTSSSTFSFYQNRHNRGLRLLEWVNACFLCRLASLSAYLPFDSSVTPDHPSVVSRGSQFVSRVHSAFSVTVGRTLSVQQRAASSPACTAQGVEPCLVSYIMVPAQVDWWIGGLEEIVV